MTRSSTEYTEHREGNELHKAASLHEALVRLKEEGPDHQVAICYNLLKLVFPLSCEADLLGLFPSWPLFSGDRVFPVPDPEGGDPVVIWFKISEEDGDFWDTSTEYGRLRWQLLDWLIEQTKPPGIDPSRVEALDELAADAQELKMGY